MLPTFAIDNPNKSGGRGGGLKFIAVTHEKKLQKAPNFSKIEILSLFYYDITNKS